jgi:hypothetical protein
MNCAVEMRSDSMTYIPSFIKNGLVSQSNVYYSGIHRYEGNMAILFDLGIFFSKQGKKANKFNPMRLVTEKVA